jgi:hypothetical protein
MSILSEEKIESLWHRTYKINPITKAHVFMDFARAIEAAMLEAQGKQDPVGLIRIRGGDVVHMEPYASCLDVPNGDYSLYAAPVIAEKQEPVAWVRYSIGCAPHFVPVINGQVRFTCSVIESLEYEPLYAVPIIANANVQPDMVMVPREPTVAMREANMNNRDELIALANEAGAELYADTICVNGKDADDFVTRFAALVAAKEREKMLEELRLLADDEGRVTLARKP